MSTGAILFFFFTVFVTLLQALLTVVHITLLRKKGYSWIVIIFLVTLMWAGFATPGPRGTLVYLIALFLIIWCIRGGDGDGKGKKKFSLQEGLTKLQAAMWGRQVSEARCSMLS